MGARDEEPPPALPKRPEAGKETWPDFNSGVAGGFVFVISVFLLPPPVVETVFCNSSRCFIRGSTVVPLFCFVGDDKLFRTEDPGCLWGSFDRSTLYALFPTLMYVSAVGSIVSA